MVLIFNRSQKIPIGIKQVGGERVKISGDGNCTTGRTVENIFNFLVQSILNAKIRAYKHVWPLSLVLLPEYNHLYRAPTVLPLCWDRSVFTLRVLKRSNYSGICALRTQRSRFLLESHVTLLIFHEILKSWLLTPDPF
jgi:hypothetical protein